MQEEHSLADGSFNVVEENSNADHGGEVVKGEEEGGPSNAAFDLSKLQNLVPKHRNDHKIKPKPAPKPKDKKPVTTKMTPKDVPSAKDLDFSDPADAKGAELMQQAAVIKGKSKMDQDEAMRSTVKSGWLSSMFRSIAGSSAALEMSDLQPALKALKDRLMTKNVAEEIAEKLCESVAASLVG
jgi:signal recognition particle receptor subunit alpha